MIFNLGSGAAAPQLTSIEVTTKPIKISYEAGETFNKSGMVVTAYFDDGSSSVVTGYTYSPTTVSLGTKTITISYTNEGITKTTTVSVSSQLTVYKYNVVGSVSETFNNVYDQPDSGEIAVFEESGNYGGIYIHAPYAAYSDSKSGRVVFTKTAISIPAGATITYNVTNSISGSGKYSNTVFANTSAPTAIDFSPSIYKNITSSQTKTNHVLNVSTAGKYYLGFRIAEYGTWSTNGTLHSIVVKA